MKQFSLMLSVSILLAGGSASALFANQSAVSTAAQAATADPSASAKSLPVTLVDNGKATARIIIPAGNHPDVRNAVHTFSERVKRATGAELPVATADSVPADDSLARIEIMVQGINGNAVTDALEPESFLIEVLDSNHARIHAAANGQGLPNTRRLYSRPLVWALNSLLEEHLGARWLWPGELGTYLPASESFAISATGTAEQPELQMRSLRLLLEWRGHPLASPDAETDTRLQREALQWAYDHRLGDRSNLRFGHSFGHWWQKYSAKHPDYFAELPKPRKQPFPTAQRVKLRLANPAVIEQIAQEYIEAGAPRDWNVSPNDGPGFDISAETRAWDYPQGQSDADIVQARGELTARYVRFWNELYERLRQINPDVRLLTYAYSSYRNAPTPERPLTANAVIQIVDTADAYDNWKGWAAGGQKLLLRPNWWHQGADAPYLSYEKNNAFLRFAYDNGMMGLDMDSVLGYWATQGFNYYSTARLLNDSGLSDEELIAEYIEPFGKGAPKIRDYLLYWAQLASQYNYPINAAGTMMPEGDFGTLVRRGSIPPSILNGSKYALPFLYTDEVIAPALVLLDEAQALVDAPGSDEARRIEFLRQGLDSLKATREQIDRGQRLKFNPTPENARAFAQGREEMEKQREQWGKDHVMWPGYTKAYEENYNILLRESALKHNQINLDGY